MLENIHIQNFRCFEDFKAEGFERINLIGGKNNSGKTCLLEAIFCLRNSDPFNGLRILRDSTIDNEIVNTNCKKNFLSIVSNVPNSNQFFQFSIKIFNGNELGVITNSSHKNMQFISQKTEYPRIDILKSIDNFSQKKLKLKIIDILKLIDDRIDDLVTYATKSGLWVVQHNKIDEPLSNFGDATKNIIRYFTPLFEKRLNVSNDLPITYLLIDEIENGIHYSAHYDFWKSLFKLSKELNVQIFATTHSLEMIQQFNKVSKEEGDAAYFEMGREYETGKIFAQKHDTELLEYELEKSTSTVRG